MEVEEKNEEKDMMSQNIIGLEDKISTLQETMSKYWGARLESLESRIDKVCSDIDTIKISIDSLNNVVVSHESKMDNKNITDSYVEMILNKIDILKQLIKKNIGDSSEELLSPHLNMVEAIENQIITTNTASETQLNQLNIIYNKQKRIK